MLDGAAMLVGLALLWLAAAGSPISVDKLAAMSFAVVAAFMVAARFGGVGSAFAQAPGGAVWLARRGPALLAAALRTLRAGLAGEGALAPALMRVRPRDNSDFGRALLSGQISAHPGMVVVESDADGLLVHVINENQVDSERLESHVGDGRAAP